MISPVATRLRELIAENPYRCNYSLLITGHSAGGAVAALLYSHIVSMSREVNSELKDVAGFFKRVHCVTFGAPPVSILPLLKPDDPKLKGSLFFSFVNEGDPITRADKPYVRSLLELYSTPAPGQSCLTSLTHPKLQPFISNSGGKSSSSLTINRLRPAPKTAESATPPVAIWPVPVATLSNAGRIVLLRGVQNPETRPKKKKQIFERMDEGVVVQMISDQLLRNVVWGDPVCHMMKLYARRIDVLAMNAVKGRS